MSRCREIIRILHLRAVESRKEFVIKSIGEKITPDIKQSLQDARTLVEIEDIVRFMMLLCYNNSRQ